MTKIKIHGWFNLDSLDKPVPQTFDMIGRRSPGYEDSWLICHVCWTNKNQVGRESVLIVDKLKIYNLTIFLVTDLNLFSLAFGSTLGESREKRLDLDLNVVELVFLIPLWKITQKQTKPRIRRVWLGLWSEPKRGKSRDDRLGLQFFVSDFNLLD